MINSPLQESTVRRPGESADDPLRRAVDAIEGLVRGYKKDEVVFFKTLDRLLLAFGGPFSLSVSDVSDATRIFETAALHNARTSGKSIRFAGAFDLRLYGPTHMPAEAAVSLAAGEAFLERVSEALDDLEADGRLLAARQRLQDGFRIASRRGAPAGIRAEESGTGMSGEEAQRQLGVFFSQLEVFLRRNDYDFALSDAEGGPSCPRFLLFHRYIDPNGAKRARLHLMASQIACIDAFAPGQGLRAAQLEEALQSDFPDIESVLDAGVTQWVNWPWERADGSRQAASRALESTFRAHGVSAGPGAPGLAIPVHVGGVPWLCLVAFYGGDHNDRVASAEYLYRDLLPYVTTTIRQLSERTYLRSVRMRAKQALDGDVGGHEQLNDALRPLTAAFPYPEVNLSIRQSGAPITWQGEVLHLSQSYGCGLCADQPPVDYTLLEATDVVGALEAAERSWQAERSRDLKQRISTYEAIGHTLKNVMEVTSWPNAAARLAQARGDLPELEQGSPSASARQRILRAVDVADRSLSLFAIAQGLGHFIRLAGAVSGQFPWHKFSGWLDPQTEIQPTGEQLVDSYARSAFRVGRLVCFGRSWLNLEVWTHNQIYEQWRGEPPPPFAVTDLHFPPFARGSDVAYAFIFCLAEPLVNAAVALKRLDPRLYAKLPDAPLRVFVEQDEDRPTEVVIRIVNFCSEIPKEISGWETTKHMLSDIGIGRFEESVSPRRINDNLLEVEVMVRFAPVELEDRIRRASVGRQQ